MALSKQQVARLNSIIATAKKMIALAEKEPASKGMKRFRRSSADAAKMKDQIRVARAKGVPATKLAEKYGVSTAYVYMIK
jgi:hypothetical protein